MTSMVGFDSLNKNSCMKGSIIKERAQIHPQRRILMKKALFLLFLICVVLLVSCTKNDIITPNQSSTVPEEEMMQSIKPITTPEDIVGTPDTINVVKDKTETIFAQGTVEYNDMLEKTKARFPDALKEAAMAIVWTDNSGAFDWTAMAEDFDYIRLSFNDKQTVELHCFKDQKKPIQQLGFYDLVFPLSEEYGDVFIVGTQRTYGVLKSI